MGWEREVLGRVGPLPFGSIQGCISWTQLWKCRVMVTQRGAMFSKCSGVASDFYGLLLKMAKKKKSFHINLIWDWRYLQNPKQEHFYPCQSPKPHDIFKSCIFKSTLHEPQNVHAFQNLDITEVGRSEKTGVLEDRAGMLGKWRREPSPSRNVTSLWLKGQNTPFLERPSFSLTNPNEKIKTLQPSTFLKGDKMVGFSAGQFDTLCWFNHCLLQFNTSGISH